MHRPRHVSVYRHHLMRMLLCALLAVACIAPAWAQTPTRPPLKRIFGVGDNEFFKGAWMKIRPDSAGTHPDSVDAHWEQIWHLADELGIDILRAIWSVGI